MLSNLTASELTGGTYHYAVDYLGTALVQAATAWAQQFDGRSLPAVDVITHSTGSVIARGVRPEPVVRPDPAVGHDAARDQRCGDDRSGRTKVIRRRGTFSTITTAKARLSREFR